MFPLMPFHCRGDSDVNNLYGRMQRKWVEQRRRLRASVALDARLIYLPSDDEETEKTPSQPPEHDVVLNDSSGDEVGPPLPF